MVASCERVEEFKVLSGSGARAAPLMRGLRLERLKSPSSKRQSACRPRGVMAWKHSVSFMDATGSGPESRTTRTIERPTESMEAPGRGLGVLVVRGQAEVGRVGVGACWLGRSR